MATLTDERLKGLNFLATGTHTNISDAERDAYSKWLSTDRMLSLDDMRRRFFFRISTLDIPIHFPDMKRHAMAEYVPSSAGMTIQELEYYFWKGVAAETITLLNYKRWTPLFVRTEDTQNQMPTNWIPTSTDFSIEMDIQPNTIVGTNILCGGEYNQSDSFYINYTGSQVAFWHNSVKTQFDCTCLVSDVRSKFRFNVYADRVELDINGQLHHTSYRTMPIMTAGIKNLGNAESGATDFSGDGSLFNIRLIDHNDPTNNRHYPQLERSVALPTTTNVPDICTGAEHGTLTNFTGNKWVEIFPLPASPDAPPENDPIWMVNFKAAGNEHAAITTAWNTFGTSWTLDFYLKLDDVTATNNLIGGTGASYYDFALSIDADDIKIVQGSFGTRTFAHSLENDTWYRIKFVNTSSNCKCYVDGVQVGSNGSSMGKVTQVDEVGGIEGTVVGFAGNMISLNMVDTAYAPRTRQYNMTDDSVSKPTATLIPDTSGNGDNASLVNFTGETWEHVSPPDGYPITDYD